MLTPDTGNMNGYVKNSQVAFRAKNITWDDNNKGIKIRIK